MSRYAKGKEPTCTTCGINKIKNRGSEKCLQCAQTPSWHVNDDSSELPHLNFERNWVLWQRAIGMARDRYAGPPKRKARTGRLKVLVVPDLHAPFHDRQKVADMFEKERDADIAIVMGDIGDGFALSRFVKYQAVPFEEELSAVTMLMQELSERFPIVKMIEGNHDNRLEKGICDRLPQDFVSAIRSMTPDGTLSPIKAAARRYPNIEWCKHEIPEAPHLGINWFTTIGDAIFLHAEKFSRIPGNAVRAIDDWLEDFEDAYAIPEWKVLVQAHTHALSWNPWRGGKLLTECGCLAQTMGYMTSPKLGGRPQRRGWMTLEQVDGQTDINSVRPFWADVERVA